MDYGAFFNVIKYTGMVVQCWWYQAEHKSMEMNRKHVSVTCNQRQTQTIWSGDSCGLSLKFLWKSDV
jgi:hypothetical protein